MNIADLDNPTVVSAPTAPKMNIADLKDPTVVPASLLAKKDEPGALEQIGRGALESVKSVGRGINTILQEASPYNKEGAHIPFSGLADDSKRREFERGVSDVTTLGLAQKIGNAASDALTPNLSLSDVASGKKRQTLESTESNDAAVAGNYREAGAVVGGTLPGVANVIPDLAIRGAGKLKGVIKPLAEKAQARISDRAVDTIATGARKEFRDELNHNVKAQLRPIIAEGDGRNIAKYADDSEASSRAVQDQIDKRMLEQQKIISDSQERFVSDSGKPSSVEGDATVKTRNAPMTQLANHGRALPPIEETLPIKRDGVPDVIGSEPSTKRIPSESMDSMTGASDRQGVIDMRRNGSLDPTLIKAKIVDRANEIGRNSTPTKRHVNGIIKDLESEINAEIEHTGEDPDIQWWRKQQTKMQKASEPTADRTVEHTTSQDAHREVANLIGDEITSHIDDPRYKQLNGEISALIKLKNANSSSIVNAQSAGKSPGKYGNRLYHFVRSGIDAHAAIAAVSTGNPLPLAIPAVMHGPGIASRNIDRVLTKIAHSKLIGKPYADLAQQAIKLGATQSAIDDVIARTHSLQTKGKEQ